MTSTSFPSRIKKLAVATALACSGAHASAAMLVADGKLDTGYQLGYTVGFLAQNGDLVGNGKIYFGLSDDQTLFFYFQMPLNYVDNTYGANAASDWGKKGHTFDNLLGSDSLGASKNGSAFGFNGNSLIIDYIACSGGDSGDKGKGKSSSCGTSYFSGEYGQISGDKNDGSLVSGSAADILEIATSLEYNLQFVDATALEDSSLDDDWIKEVGYEIQFKADTFDPSEWLDPDEAFKLITLGTPHVSPPKTEFDRYEEPECDVGCEPGGPPVNVPEPGTLGLIGLGFAGAGWMLRRRKPETTTPSSET